MEHLPIFLNVKGRRTLVVGSGVTAARKADLLLRAGSDVTIVSPEIGEELSQLRASYEFTHKSSALAAEDLTLLINGCASLRPTRASWSMLRITRKIVISQCRPWSIAHLY
jgi:siroheme synthase-like protein